MACRFPGCTLNGSLDALRCPFPDCEEHLHHFCFAGFCDRYSIPDPNGDYDRFCWSCVTEMLADDDEKIASAVQSELARAGSAEPVPT